MKLHPVFYEPEIQSAVFLFANVFLSVLVYFLYYSWPLSIYWSCFYFILVYIINHAITTGRHYWPSKNLRGQTVVITGAASGIGRVCALQFAKLGARVIIGIRGQKRAEKVADDLSKESNGGSVIGYDLDLTNLANVKQFAENIDKVDILLNNAGTTQESFSLTTDGIETAFQTNHLGHFYLTQLLLPLLDNSRVINVSSIVHHIVKATDIDYSTLKSNKYYNGLKAYSFSKLAQIYHARELARRHGIRAYSVHPGTIVASNMKLNTRGFNHLIFQSLILNCKTIEQGAMTSLYCALSDDVQSGHFYSNCQKAEASSLALDNQRAEQCWNETEKLINEIMK